MATTRIKSGSKSVYVNGRPAARVGDATVKGGLGSIGGLATTITDAASGVTSKINKIKSTISGATSFISDLKAQVGDEIAALTAPISDTITSLTSLATEVVNQVKEVTGSLTALPEDVLGELTSGLLDSTSIFGALKTEIGGAIADVSSIPADLLTTIASVKNDIAGFTSFITDFPTEISGQFTSELDALQAIFDGVIPDLGSLVDIGSVLTETAQGVVPSLVDIAPVLTFNSLNDLRVYFDATKSPADRSAVNIISYHPGYGLGGGTFIYEADNQSPETNGNVVVDAAGRRWIRVTNNEAIKAVDFGVLPNTGKDATASLNEASLAAQTKRSAIDNSQVCEVLLPSGEILIENQLLMRDGVVFRGDSSNGTVIVVSWEFNTTAIKIINENANSAIAADQRAANIGFKNVRFKTKGSPPVGTGVINLSYANTARFSNLRFTLLNGAVAFAVNDLQSPVLDSIDVAGGDLLKVNTPIGSTFGVNNGAISKATVVGGRLLLDGISSLNQLTDIKIDGQNALATTFSIGADAFRNKVSGLVTKGATTTGLLIAGDQNTVADVVLEHPGIPASIVSGNDNNIYGVFTGTIVSNVSGDDNTFEGTFNVTDDPPWIDTGLRNSFNNSILQGQIDELEAGASDGILTPSDKVAIVPLLKDLINSQAGLNARAAAFGVTTENTAFNSAMTTLNNYLATLTTPVAWDNQTGNTTIASPTTFVTNYRTALEARSTLQRALETALGASISDGVLTPGEKLTVVSGIKELVNSQSGLNARAAAFGITTENTAFNSAMTTLNNYLATLTTPVAWDSQAGNTTIAAPATFISNYQGALDARGTLERAIETSLGAALSDGILTPGEKVVLVPGLKDLINTATGLDTRANALGITTERTAFSTAISTLTSYLATLTTPVAWDNQSGNTTVAAPATFITNHRTALETRQSLITKIDELNANATVPASSANSVWFSQFEQELTGWSVGESTSLTKSNVFLDGNQKKCFRVNVTFTASGQYIVIGQDTVPGLGRITDVVPGTRMFVSCGIEVGLTSGTAGTPTGELQVQWFNAAGGFISSSQIQAYTGNQSFGTRLKGFITVPANAVKAAIYVYLQVTAAATRWLLITEPMVTQAHALQTFEPAFVPGPTADTRLLGLGTNLMYNSRLSPDLSGYGGAWNGTVGGTPQRGLNASGKFGARNVAWVQCSNTPANDTIVEGEASVGPIGVLSDLRRYAIEVTPGDRLYVSMMFGFVGFKNAYLVVTYGDSTGVYVAEVGTGTAALTSPGNGDLGTAMTRQGGFVTVPANAKWAWLRPRFTANGSGVTPIGYWSDPYVAKVPAVQTTPPPFSHGEISRGAIVDQIPPTAQIDNGRVIGTDANRVRFSEGEFPAAIGLQVTALPSGVTNIGVTSVTNSGRRGYRITFTTDGAKAPAMRMGWDVAYGARLNSSEKFVASLVAVPGAGVTAAAGFNEFDSSGVSNGFAAIAAVAGGFAGQKYAQMFTAQPTTTTVCLYVRLDVGAAGTFTCDIFEPLVTGATADQTALPNYSVGINATDGADVTRQNPAGGLMPGATQFQSDGTQRQLPYGVLEKWLEDGESWTFPTTFAVTPKVKSIQGGKRTSSGLSGDQVQVDTFVVTPSGLTASLKNKELVGSPTTQTQNTWSNISSVRRDAHKPTSADAFDGSYTFSFSLDLYAPYSWYDTDIPYPGATVYYGEATVTVYTDDGGGRVARGSVVRSYGGSLSGRPFENPASIHGTVTGEITFTAPALGQHAGLEFSVEITSRTHTSTVFNGSNSATYKTASGPASASRTTPNEKVLVRVEAGQEL